MSLNYSRQLLGTSVIALSLLLSACGFQLRGTGVDNVQLEELRLSARNSYGQTYMQVREALEIDGVRLSDSASYHLQLLDESQSRDVVSYTSRATPAELELTSRLTFQVSDKRGRALIGPETLSAQRVFVNDKDNIIGSSEEEQLLQREMRRDLTRQMLFRLSSLSESELASREQALDQQAR